MASLPPELLDLVLSWHMPICAQQFTGNPHYTLYWCYDKKKLKELLGMTRDQYRVVQSSLGQFMRRVPKTSRWLSNTPTPQAGGWALTPDGVSPGKSVTGGLQVTGANGSSRRSPAGAVARRPIARKSYVGLLPPEIKQFT